MAAIVIRLCYDEVAKKVWSATYKRQLRKVAQALNLGPDAHDLRFNPGGIAVWGEVTLHADWIYIQASRSMENVLVRSCTSRQDYTGGRNQYLPVRLLLTDPAAFAEQARQMISPIALDS